MTTNDSNSPAIYMEHSVLLYIDNGEVAINIDDGNPKNITLTQGNVIYIERGCHIRLKNKDKSLTSIKTIILSKDVLKKIAHILNIILPESIEAGQHRKHFIRNEIPLSSYFFKEINEASSNALNTPSEKTSAIIYLLSFFYCHVGFHDSITRSITHNLSDKVYSLVSSGNDSKWTLPMCAKALYMSSSTLKRKLMQEGKTFSEIYQDVKMNKSITLLMTSSKPIASIANECGFSSSASFSTAFKKKHGISPRKLIKKVNAG